MYQPLCLWWDTLAASDFLQEDKGNSAAVQGGQGEDVDYAQVDTEESGKLQ